MKNTKLLITLLGAFLFALPFLGSAQCTISVSGPTFSTFPMGNDPGFGSFGAVGQTFQACQTGDLTSFAFTVNSVSSGPVNAT